MLSPMHSTKSSPRFLVTALALALPATLYAANQLTVTAVNKLPLIRTSQTIELTPAQLAPLGAKELGANGYITKPIEREGLLRSIAEILSEQVTVNYWGVHGTLPVPGTPWLRYGGNTPCVAGALTCRIGEPSAAFFFAETLPSVIETSSCDLLLRIPLSNVSAAPG